MPQARPPDNRPRDRDTAVHVHPPDDLHHHLLRYDSCPCHPDVDRDPDGLPELVVHHAWDERP